jgi:hypothetical protein
MKEKSLKTKEKIYQLSKEEEQMLLRIDSTETPEPLTPALWRRIRNVGMRELRKKKTNKNEKS